MKILVVTDKSNKTELGNELKQKLIHTLEEKQYDFKHYCVDKNDLHCCIGCFSCWLKTPGLCVFNDISRDINRNFIESDYVIFVTPIKYGCYSTAIKRVLDRSIPNILPFFKKINGEVHHAPRYDKYPQLVMVGYGDDISKEEERTFISLTNANAINYQIKEAKTYICREKEDGDNFIKDFFKIIN
jgi:multimeric flavodoxin WrbA